jgi:hypothetical protein
VFLAARTGALLRWLLQCSALGKVSCYQKRFFLLGLGGCETGGPARRLDDTSVPLMKPGYGLVATTLIERSRLHSTDQPVSVATAGESVAFYDTVRGSGGSAFVVHPRGETRASLVNPNQPGKADRGYLAFLTPVKPGKYHLNQLMVGVPGNQQGVGPKDEPVFEVVEGEVTYAGSMQMLSRVERHGSGYVPVRRTVEVVDEYAKDIPAVNVPSGRARKISGRRPGAAGCGGRWRSRRARPRPGCSGSGPRICRP